MEGYVVKKKVFVLIDSRSIYYFIWLKVGLPLTARRHDSIFVVVDTLTKSAHFIPVRTTYQAPDIARVFISEIVERKGPMAYRLALPDSLRRMQDVFHVSVLRHDISDPTHVIDLSSLQVYDKEELMAETIRILDHRVRQLRRLDQVKVQWDNYSPHSATWEDAYDMHQQFPFLFDR